MSRTVHRGMQLLLSAILFLSSCSLIELEDASAGNDSWISTVPSAGSLYAVGVQYPVDYNWKADPDGSESACSLFVWQSGRVVMRIAAGAAHEVSLDPDSYRMAGGKLYTDYSSASETVVKVNGRELFRYPGREFLVGFKVEGEEVYTLGNSRSGKGFSFRKNGKLLFGDGMAVAWPHLEGKDGDYAFCFRKPGSGTAGEDLVFRFEHGKPSPVLVETGVERICDAMVAGDELLMLVLMEEDPMIPVLLKGRDKLWLDSEHRVKQKVSSCRLFPQADGTVYSHVYSGKTSNSLWRDNELLFSASGFSDLLDLEAFGDQYMAYLPATGGRNLDLVLHDGQAEWMPKGFSVMGPRPLCLWQGSIYAALSSRDGGKPMVWNQGRYETLEVNGYLYEVGVVE